MVKKNFYSVAKGRQPGIYKDWSACELNTNKFNNAVYQGFADIDQAIMFLFAGNAFTTCNTIPVYDSEGKQNDPSRYGHVCMGTQGACTLDSLVEHSESDSECDITMINSEETEILKPVSSNTENINLEPSVSDITCLKKCGKKDNDNMISCTDCRVWIHFECTELPLYQLYSLVSTKRKFTCEKCSKIPDDFLSKFQEIHMHHERKPTYADTGTNTNHILQTSNIGTNTMDILQTPNNEKQEQAQAIDKTVLTTMFNKLESNLVSAVTETHKLYLETDIDNLKVELQNERLKTSQLNDRVTKLSAEKAELNLKVELQKERQKTSLLNDKVTKLSAETAELKESVKNITVKEVETSNNNNTPNNETSHQDESEENSNPMISTSYSFQHTMPISNSLQHPDSEKDDFELWNGEPTTQNETEKGKIVLIGNSHFKPIQVNNFIYEYDTVKYIAYTCEEAKRALSKETGPLDCLVMHLFSNNIKENSTEESLNIFADFFDFIHTKWPSLPIIVSDTKR